MIEVGIVGCGAVVHEMYPKVLLGRPDYAVRYVHDIRADQAASAAELFSASAVDLEVLLERSDAVVITTPPSTHADLVRRALRPGRIVLCEKPFVVSHASASTLAGEALAAETRLYVGQFRRAFPQLELARQLVSLGLLGPVEAIAASEGGRFTWSAVSDYTTQDPTGGVLWDAGAHTLDMALFAGGLDLGRISGVRDIRVQRSKSEPSHDFLADFTVEHEAGDVAAHLHVSRLEVLPNRVEIKGARGSIEFSVSMDDRLRITTPGGSVVISADRSHSDLLECFDLQMTRILRSGRAEDFEAGRFVGQICILEALANAQ